MKDIALCMIKWYQRTVSQVLPPSCRFTPTCSQYTFQAIQQFGFFKGGWLGFKRIMRCHPFHACGFDPVPQKWRF